MYFQVTLGATMKEVLDYMFNPPESPRPYYNDRLDVQSLGDVDSPLSAAAGHLLLGLRYSPLSTGPIAGAGFQAAQASHAVAALKKLSQVPQTFTALLDRLEQAIDATFTDIEARHKIPRSRFLDRPRAPGK